MTIKWMAAGLAAGVLVSLGWRAVEHSSAGESESALGLSSSVNSVEPFTQLSTESEPAPREEIQPAGETTSASSVVARGRLRSSEGAALTNASVVFSNDEGGRHVALASDTAWGLVDLPSGRWTVEAAADGHVTLFEECVVPPRMSFHHDFQLEASGVIPIRLVDLNGDSLSEEFSSGGALEGAWSVQASAEAQESPIERSRRRRGEHAGGNWRTRVRSGDLPHLPASYMGELALKIKPPLYVALVLGSEIIEQVRFETVPADWVIRLDVDRIQSALGGMRLQSLELIEGNRKSRERLSVSARSLEWSSLPLRFAVREGRYENLKMPAGAYELTVESARRGGYFPALTKRITIERGRVVNLGELSIVAPEPVFIEVTGVDTLSFALLEGEPLQPAPLQFEYEKAADFWEHETGGFTLLGLPMGPTEFVLSLADDRRYRFPQVSVLGTTLVLSLADAIEVETREGNQ